MRTLAIDLGTRRVGLALSDEGGRYATPFAVLEIRSPAHAIDLILPILAGEDVKRIIIGLPLNMDDTIGPQAKQTIGWAAELNRQSGIACLFVDERLSSFAAEQTLTDRRRAGEKLTHKRKKEQQDALAAAGFLQAFLDGKLGVIEVNAQ